MTQEQNAQESPQVSPEPAAAPAPAPVTLGQAPETQAPPRVAPPLPEGAKYIWGTGRRKKAIARVRLRPGSGVLTVNERPLDKFFTEEKDRRSVLSPLTTVNMVKSWDVFANVTGGGFAGQAGAVSLGIARALCKAMPDLLPAIRDQNLLTRDARMKERKKYGQKGARKRFQFSKR